MKSPSGYDLESIIPPLWVEGQYPVTSIALDVIGVCNIQCKYCAESATQPKRKPMSEETLVAAWKFLFPDGKPKKGFSIRMGSGEPLLNFPLLQKMAELEPKADISITTNGTLMDDKMVEWFINSGWDIKISIDGPKHVQDNWRVTRDGEGTYNRIEPAVKEFARRIPDRFSVTAVLCRGTDPAEVFDYFETIGVKKIEIVPAVHGSDSVRPGEKELELHRKFIYNYAKRWIEDEGQPPMLNRFVSAMTRAMGYTLSRVNCGAGRNFFGIGPEGDIYPCFRFVGVEKYKIGNVFTGLDLDAAKAYRETGGRAYDLRTPCKNCWAAPICGGPCFAVAELFGPGDGSPYEVFCNFIKIDAEAALYLVEQLQEQNPERLLKFLPPIDMSLVTGE